MTKKKRHIDWNHVAMLFYVPAAVIMYAVISVILFAYAMGVDLLV